MGRHIILDDKDATAREFKRLDDLSRTRALTLAESVQLEGCIHRLEMRKAARHRYGLIGTAKTRRQGMPQPEGA